MSWKALCAERRLEPHRATREEVDGLRTLAQRDLADAEAPGLSADTRFALAFAAALHLARLAVAAAGYRARGPETEATLCECLPLAMGPAQARRAVYLDRCRRKRERAAADVAGTVGRLEADELVRETAGLRVAVEEWIARKRPYLAG